MHLPTHGATLVNAVLTQLAYTPVGLHLGHFRHHVLFLGTVPHLAGTNDHHDPHHTAEEDDHGRSHYSWDDDGEGDGTPCSLLVEQCLIKDQRQVSAN